jgi:hypothetical protein
LESVAYGEAGIGALRITDQLRQSSDIDYIEAALGKGCS